MGKRLSLLMAIILLGGCSGREARIERTFENGVEVVLNHIEPYRVPGEPSALVLEKDYIIDSERPDFFKAGLTDIFRFGVGSDGSVYIAQRPRKAAPVIFKFDERGRLQNSFGRVGQGPGEIERCAYFGVIGRDEIYVLDAQRNKITTFAPSGELVKETLLPRTLVGGLPLRNGYFLAPQSDVSPNADQEEIAFNILDGQFALVRVMHRVKFAVQFPGAAKVNAYLTNPAGSFDTDRIYIGLPGRDYEVLVFDLEGNPVRKIHKDYEPVAVTAAFRKEALARLPQGSPVAERLEFPDCKPSFQYMFADEKGRLFVATSEVDEASGQNVCDVFNASGVLICRAAVGYYDLLRTFWEGVTLDVVARNGRFYVLHEKENGYKELVVSKAIWR
jgi:6-bladed beta-propeller